MRLALATRNVAGWTVVRVGGELDYETVPQLDRYAGDLIEQGRDHLVVDLDAVDFMDSSGLGVLVKLCKRLRACQGRLHVVTADPATVRLFRITGLGHVIPIYSSVAGAVDNGYEYPSGEASAAS